MSRKNDWQRIREAVEGGLNRETSKRAAPEQVLTYVLSDRKFFAHASLQSAKAEKDFLEVALGRKIKVYKLWNAKSDNIETDMMLIRSEAEKLLTETCFYAALNRMLIGAGY